jgi:Na+-transporting NADH:ubiquinone oxidoreductase subunit B
MSQFEPGGMFSFDNCFMGTIPGSIGETSTLAILIGAAILILTGIGSWRIMLSFLIGGLSMAWIFNLAGANAFMGVSPLHQVVMGGFMFGMVFMATDPVTAAQTATGKLIYGFFGGFLSIMIRVFNGAYPEGVMMAILFMNIMAPLIDHYVVQANVKRRMKRATLKTA